MNRCKHCPIADGVVCPASLHARYCELANSDHPSYHAGMAARLIELSQSPSQGRRDQPHRDIDSARIIAIETCDFRRSDCGCLGKPAHCQIGGYTAIVNCLDCTEIA